MKEYSELMKEIESVIRVIRVRSRSGVLYVDVASAQTIAEFNALSLKHNGSIVNYNGEPCKVLIRRPC